VDVIERLDLGPPGQLHVNSSVDLASLLDNLDSARCQQATVGLAARAVISLVVGITDPLDRCAADWAWLSVLAVRHTREAVTLASRLLIPCAADQSIRRHGSRGVEESVDFFLLLRRLVCFTGDSLARWRESRQKRCRAAEQPGIGERGAEV
jgi:hypothetical protein